MTEGMSAERWEEIRDDIESWTMGYYVYEQRKNLDEVDAELMRLRSALARAEQFWHDSEAECRAVQERLDSTLSGMSGRG